MTVQEQTTSATGLRARLRAFFGDLRAIVVAITAAIAIVVAFIDAVAGLYNRTEPLLCSVIPQLPWCPKTSTSLSWSNEVGGPGGTEFGTTTCRADELLVGLAGRADNTFVYSVGPICAPGSFNAKHQLTFVSEATRNGEQAGSDRGTEFSLKCPIGMFVIGYQFDSAVIGTNFGPHEYLTSPLRLRCSAVSADNRASTVVAMPGAAQTNASHKSFLCDDGSGAFGIKGRAGQFVDAIRLGCRSIR